MRTRRVALLRLAPRVRTLCITPRPLPHWSTKVEEEWAPGTRSWIPGSPPPRKLTSMITSAPSAKALVGVLEQHGAAFNAVHCGALWVRLGALARLEVLPAHDLRVDRAVTHAVSDDQLDRARA